MKVDSALRTICLIAACKPESAIPDELLGELKKIKNNTALWSKLFLILRIAKITELFFWQLSQHSLEDLIPDKSRAKFEKRYKNARSKNTALIGKLGELNTLLEAEGIQCAAWKGVPLLTHCYPDIGSRPMSDVDLIVNASDREVVINILNSMGFSENFGLGQTSTKYQAIDENGLEIDIHLNAEFFENYSFEELHRRLNFPPLIDSYFAPQPEVILAYHIKHWRKHSHSWGILLRHFYDMIFLYRQFGESFNTDLFETFLSEPEEWVILLRANILIRKISPDTKIPPFSRTISQKGFSIAEAKRSSLFARSHLTRRKKAWGRLILSRFGIVKARSPISPNIADIFLSILDKRIYSRELEKLKEDSERISKRKRGLQN